MRVGLLLGLDRDGAHDDLMPQAALTNHLLNPFHGPAPSRARVEVEDVDLLHWGSFLVLSTDDSFASYPRSSIALR